MSSEDIVNTHDTFMKSLGIELSDDDKRLPYLYWTPKLQKSPVKHRFIAGSRATSIQTFDFSTLYTSIPHDLLKSSMNRIINNAFKVVRNKKSKFFSHRNLIEFYETNRMSHVPHLYDVVNLLK